MNKKKACIESLAALEAEGQGPANKIAKYDMDEDASLPKPSTLAPGENASARTGTEDGQLSPAGPVVAGINTSSPDQDDSQPPTENIQMSKNTQVNNLIFTSEMRINLQEKYSAQCEYFDDATGVKLSCSPFRHCVFPNFLSNSEYIKDLESALFDLPLRDKNNDLYKFCQSRDLNHSKSSTISAFKSACETVRHFLAEMTQIPLNAKVDLFCSQYKYTDVLLCHDDELEERRIAFIYYLVPETWCAADGGTLDLFDIDEHEQPKSIVKSIVPKRNSFLFFEVSAKSFHQVAEVLSEDKTRLSISGWFHGPPLARPSPHVEPLSPAVPYGSIEEDIFYAWFNPLYLAPEVQTDVRKRFEEDSEIELTDFLQEEKYNDLVTALQDESVEWSLLGPANKRNYYAADKTKLPAIVSEFLRILHSDAAFLVLSNLTGLKLHPLAPTSDDEDTPVNGESSANGGVSSPCCRSEVRRWEHGCYTLAHDTDADMKDFALDTMMYIGCGKEWSYDNGGYTSYAAKGETDELLSVCPAGNSLSLVYRDKDIMKFVKHMNHGVTKLRPPKFYEINTVYYE